MKYEPQITDIDGLKVEFLYVPPEHPDGMVCLAVHGNAGGWDQAYDMAISILPERIGILAVSRFGYLRSGLPETPVPEQQAAVFSALLDELGIRQVIVLGGSAGSFAAVRFALKYPEKTARLIMLAGGAYSPEISKSPPQGGPPEFLIGDFCFGLMRDLFPGTFRSMFNITDKEWEAASEDDRAGYNAQIKGMFPINPRKAGMIADLHFTVVDPVNHYERYRVEDLACPVLIMQASNDPWTSEEAVRDMAARIPNAVIIITEGGGHVMLGHGRLLREATKKFLSGELNENKPRE